MLAIISIFCCALMLVSALSREWLPSQPKLTTGIFVVLLVSLSVFLNWMTYLGLSAWLTYMILFFVWSKTTKHWIKNTLFVLLLFGFVLFAARVVPGFERVTLANEVFINSAGVQTDLKFSLDKTLAGFTVLLFLLGRSKIDASSCVRVLIPSSIFLIVFYGFAAFTILTWQAQWPSEKVLLFMVFNAIFTCVPEEAFFRLMVQKPIYSQLQKTSLFGSAAHLALVSIFLTSLIFTLLHIPWAPSLIYLVFVFAAGCFYAWVYHATRLVTASVLAHFSLNALHMTLFSYP